MYHINNISKFDVYLSAQLKIAKREDDHVIGAFTVSVSSL